MLSVEHRVRYTWKGTSFFTAMSKMSVLAEWLYVLVVDVSVSKIRQEFSSA